MSQSLLTVKDACNLLSISRSTVYRYCDYGLLPHIRKTFGIRFRREDLESWIEKDRREVSIAKSILNNALTNSPPADIDKAKGGIGRMARKGHSCRNYGYGRIYTRKTKGKQLRWYIDYLDIDGKRVRKVVKDAITKELALVALQDEVLKTFKKRTGVSRKNERIRFTEFSKIFLKDYIMISRRAWKSDLYRLEKLEDYFKNTELTKITPIMIERFRAERLRAGNSGSTANRYLALLKRLFSVAIEEGYVEANPVKKVKFYSEKATVKECVLSEEEEAALLRQCSKRLRPVVRMALNTGMRKSEILGLRWSCVNLVKRLIRVENAKSGRVRFIPINDTVYEELQALERERGDEFIFPYRSVRTAFESARRRAGLGGVRFHDLRHTFASRLIEKGVDVETVRSLLGHSSIMVTQRYTHANDERKRQAVDLLGRQKRSFMAHHRHTEKESEPRELPIPSFSVN